jgi:glutamine amidotransferase
MCRLFGFRSVINSQVHRSLVSADNALGVQSERHPDGWGVAYYIGGSPHLIKSCDQALSDHLFHRVSGVVSSQTVLAHIRKATQGTLSPLNSHPFQYGRWIFAHNGNLKAYAEHHPEVLGRVHPQFRRFVLGDTDSELFFYLLLTHMERRRDVHRDDFDIDELAEAAAEAIAEVTEIVGPLMLDGGDPRRDENFLTFIATNGRIMLGHQGGQPLFFSTHKTRCPDRDTCPSFAPECEMVSRSGFVNHLVLSSEPLHGENVWTELGTQGMVGVDRRMRLRRFDAPAA